MYTTRYATTAIYTHSINRRWKRKTADLRKNSRSCEQLSAGACRSWLRHPLCLLHSARSTSTLSMTMSFLRLSYTNLTHVLLKPYSMMLDKRLRKSELHYQGRCRSPRWPWIPILDVQYRPYICRVQKWYRWSPRCDTIRASIRSKCRWSQSQCQYVPTQRSQTHEKLHLIVVFDIKRAFVDPQFHKGDWHHRDAAPPWHRSTRHVDEIPL
jgi:hypothetical protein